LRLARAWGYPAERPVLVLPGNGGVQLDSFRQTNVVEPDQGTFTVINPRGFRAYVCNDTFFKAIPLVLKHYPQARFLCPSMIGEAQAERWVNETGIEGAVELLPRQSPPQMAALFQQAQVAVSITTHDGTPNTLLEAMACGCFPVVGDLETLREWIVPGVNGLLVEPDNPAGLAEAIVLACEHPELRSAAAQVNRRLVEGRANYPQEMAKAEGFYEQVIK
jgi:glycosyltransferase involved in cell wall biosynthesis